MKITGNEPANPVLVEIEVPTNVLFRDGKGDMQKIDGVKREPFTNTGLTIRQQFAMVAMQGILSNHCLIDSTEWVWLASNSVSIADALIEELNKEKTK